MCNGYFFKFTAVVPPISQSCEDGNGNYEGASLHARWLHAVFAELLVLVLRGYLGAARQRAGRHPRKSALSRGRIHTPMSSRAPYPRHPEISAAQNTLCKTRSRARSSTRRSKIGIRTNYRKEIELGKEHA